MSIAILAIAIAISPAFATGPSPQSPVPSPLITRSEAVYRLVEANPRLATRAAWYRSHLPPLPLFRDVPQWDAFAPYLEVAFEEGIIAGNRERLFYPHDPVSTLPTIPTLPTTLTEPIIPTLPTTPTFAISLPTLNIQDLPIAHPADATTAEGMIAPLKEGVGHLLSFPGGGGKVMIYGHSSGYPWDVSPYTKIFRQVNRLEPGDPIVVEHDGRSFTYVVAKKESVPAGDLRPFQEEGDAEELVLYTCWPPDSTVQRYLVHAEPTWDTSQNADDGDYN